MKITQIRDDGKVYTVRTLQVGLLVEELKTEPKGMPVSAARHSLQYTLPGDRNIDVQKLPKLIPAAVFVRKGGMLQFTAYNGIVMLEVNRLAGASEVERVKQRAREMPQTYMAVAGPSGKSVKIWVRFTYPDDKLPVAREQAEIFHAHAYRLAVKCYQPQLGFDIHLREPALDQFFRWTVDPELYFNPDAMPIYMQQPISMPEETTYREVVEAEQSPLKRMAPGIDANRVLTALYEAAYSEALGAVENWKRGDNPHPVLILLAESCFRAGIPEEETIRQSFWRFREEEEVFIVRQVIHNTYQSCKGFGSRNSLTQEQLLVLQLNDFMQRRYEFRYNTQTTGVEYRERVSFHFYFRPLTKRVQNSISLNAQEEGIKAWDRDIDRFLNSDRVPIYQPFEEFLSFLPRWDGKDYISDLARRVKCDHPHWESLFRRWFLNMVAHWRGFDKKYANCTAPLLVGPQGFRKSSFCRIITPPGLQGYYTDSIDFSCKRDAELALNRYGLINIDEFDQISPNQQAYLKHILQKPTVNVRRPHASVVQELRRYASFMGTSNQEDLLTDTSGSRRYICIKVLETIDLSRPVYYEQLYAQAMEALYRGERYWFDAQDEDIITEHNQGFENKTAAEQLLLVYYRAAKSGEEGEWLLAADIVQRIQKNSKVRLSVGQLTHFGRVLSKLGIESHRKTHGVYYHVVRIEAENNEK